ncbi:elongation factor 1-delta-like isoform X2 [Stigmatopora argus]
MESIFEFSTKKVKYLFFFLPYVGCQSLISVTPMDPLSSEPKAAPGSESAAATPERSIISGDNLQFGKTRRPVRTSQSEPQEENSAQSSSPGGSYGRSPGVRPEAFKRQSFSPRSPNARGHWVKRPQQDPAQIPTVKSSGKPHRSYGGGRFRTSSETGKAGKGGWDARSRKRGLSESENSAIMSGIECLGGEKVWFDKPRYDEAERKFYEGANGPAPKQQQSSSHSGDQEMNGRMKTIELENQALHKVVRNMQAALQKLESRVAQLEKSPASVTVPPPVKAAPVKQAEDEDDDDVDLFGSDEEDEEAARLKQARVDAYAAKKAKKPVLIAKSSILLDVKPWDDETDMSKLEECVRSVAMDGLLWGASKLVPVGYGIKKLQINCVVEDDKVGTDILEEEITKFEDFIQSVDVAAFNKI